MRTIKKTLLALALCAAIFALGLPTLRFQHEKSRRRHQIGQLWSLIRFYYAPCHDGHYPNALADLRSLPMYSPFFERAIREIDLIAPGIEQDAMSPKTIALEERSADNHGGIWVHYVDGVIAYRQQPGPNHTLQPTNAGSEAGSKSSVRVICLRR